LTLWLRMIWLALAGRTRAASGLMDVCLTPFRVWPSDLDVFGYMNNAKYLAVMDLARVDWLIRSGKWRKLMRARLVPMVTRTSVRHRRSLKIGRAFHVESSLVAWNERDFFALQRFMVGDECMAEGLVQGRFVRAGVGSVASAEVFSIVDASNAQPRIMLDGEATFESVWAATIKEGRAAN
jgi:acyl-CoA thioesterase FadM